jgi:hypothetical protein
MERYQFDLLLSGPSVLEDRNYGQLRRRGRDVLGIGQRPEGRQRVQFASFAVEAADLDSAVAIARGQIEGALPGLRITAVEPWAETAG